MQKEISITVPGVSGEPGASVWLTDEPEKAFALQEAGACVLFLLTPENAGKTVPGIEWCFQLDGPAALLEELERWEELGLSEDFLRRVWQRRRGLPWHIADTQRLSLREMTAEDVCAVRALCAPEQEFLFGTDGDAWECFGAAGAVRGCFGTDAAARECFGAVGAARDRFGAVDAVREGTGAAGEEDASLREWLEAYIRHMYGFYGFGLWAVERRGSGREAGAAGSLIGLAGLQMREGREEPELGFCIAPAFRGQGYGLEACRAVLRYGFGELGLPAVRAAVRRENAASLRLCRKLGFVPVREAAAQNTAAPPERDPAELRLTRDLWEAGPRSE